MRTGPSQAPALPPSRIPDVVLASPAAGCTTRHHREETIESTTQSTIGRLGAAIAAAATIWSCADCFFSIRGHLVECGTTTPIAGASIAQRIDDGFHKGTFAKTFTTGAGGEFDVGNDATEACGALVTLTLTKDGYRPLSMQFKGRANSRCTSCA